MVDDRDSARPPARREFLGMAIAGTATALGITAVIPAVAFLQPGSRRMAGAASAGKVQNFPAGTARMVLLDDRPILVVRLPDGEFRAVVAVCTHLGCIVQFSAERKRIECPCHRGVFALDGSNISGPPPRPLETLPVAIEDGVLMVRSS